MGVHGDHRPVAGDRGDDDYVLPVLEDRRLSHGAISGLGQLRERAEIRNRAVEHCVCVLQLV